MLPLFILAHFSHHVIAALLQPLLPFIRDDFALDYTQAGWVISAYTLAYGISQLPAGWLADRIGPRILITVGISGVGLAGLLVGLSPTYVMLIIFLVLMGAMGGGYHPSASPLVSESVDPNRRGRALGIHQIGGTASFFLTPLIAVGVAAVLGWRGTFISLAVVAIGFGIVLYLLLGRRGYTRKSEVAPVDNGAEAPPSYSGRLRHLTAFIILGVSLQTLLFSAVSLLPLFVVDHFGASVGAAAVLLAIYHFAGLWAGPLGGYLSDRVGKVPVMLLASLIAGPAIYLLGMVSLGWSIYIVLLVMGMTQYIGMPISEAYIISHTSKRNRSSVLGIYYFASRGGPGVIVPVVGYLFDRFGFSAGFTAVGAALLIIVLGCAAFLWRSRDSSPHNSSSFK